MDAVSRTFAKERQKVDIAKARVDEEGKKKILTALVGEQFSSKPELTAAALHYCKRAMKRRNNFVREVLDQKT